MLEIKEDILVVDDEIDIRTLISGILEDEGYEARVAESGEQALEQIKIRMPALVILDVWLASGSMDGMHVLKKIQDEHSDLPVLMISGHGTIEMAVAAVHSGAYDFIAKPFKLDSLLIAVRRALDSARLKRENDDLRSQLGTHAVPLIGKSKYVQALRAQCQKASAVDSNILFSGKTGVGKGTLGRIVHENSKRSNRPFISVSAQNIDLDKIAESVFGREDKNGNIKVGLLEKAHGGSIFFENLENFPKDIQHQLVKVLASKSFERVGANESVNINVRFMASVEGRIGSYQSDKHSTIAQDLLLRIGIIQIYMAGLNERADDVIMLIEYYIEHFSALIGRKAVKIADSGEQMLLNYDWPGNIRSLRNICERLVLQEIDIVDKETLKPLFEKPKQENSKNLSIDAKLLAMNLKDAREAFEVIYIVHQYRRFGGAVSKVAEFIGMTRTALYRKLKQLGITVNHDDGAN